MDTRHLRGFLKIADTGSISRAAESLGIAQPSLSQQLLRLEDEVGIVLFRRTSKGVALTAGGRIFQEHARQLLRAADQAIEDANQGTGEVSGTVVLAVPYSISSIAGLPLLDSFRRHAPNISFRLVEGMTGAIRGWLDAGKIDLGIIHEIGPLRHLSTRHVATEELYFIGPAGEFGSLDDVGSISLEEVADRPLLMPGRQHGLRQTAEHAASQQNLELNIGQELDVMRLIAPMVARGNGYSILPLSVVGKDLAANQVSIARIGDGTLSRNLCLVRNGSQIISHASMRAEDLAMKVLRRLVETGVWVAEIDDELI